MDDICSLAKKFYPHDFIPNEVFALRRKLEHYKIVVLSYPRFQIITFLSEVCRWLVEAKMLQHHFLIDKLIHVMLTFTVSTTAIEYAISTMEFLKILFFSKVENEFPPPAIV